MLGRADARFRWPYSAAVAVLVVGLAVTAALAVISARDYSHNESRLTELRAHDVAGALTSVLPSIQTPLASAAALADATNGNVLKFKQFIAPFVGLGPGRPFVSVSLWRVTAAAPAKLAVLGTPPQLAGAGVDTAAFLRHAAASRTLSVIGLLSGANPRLGEAYSGITNGPFAAYGEEALPPSHYEPPQRNAAFNDLSYALYLGRSTRRADLLIASVRRLPLRGQHAVVRVPFGDGAFTVVVAAHGSLAGALPQRLPWMIAIAGGLLTLAATALIARLIDRRLATERLAAELQATAEENRRLYAEQRSIAQTLQHALLPASIPQHPGLQLGARYAAGAEGVDIGGDWYDLIELGDGRLLVVVGDVSGKGLPAARAMAALRFAIHAYSAQGDDPSVFLPKLSRLLNVQADRHLATVLCAVVEADTRQLSITNAGHLPPLMISDHSSEYLETSVGLPVGIERDPSYASVRVAVPAGATILAFTDGLVERRGESIEAGLERLRSRVAANHATLDQLLTGVLHDRREDAPDDTAVAAIRWLS